MGTGKRDRTTLAEMLEAGKYVLVDMDVREDVFTVDPALYTTEGSRLYRLDRGMKTPELLAAINAEGCKPDGLEKLLAFGEEHPDFPLEHTVYALGSSQVFEGIHDFPCLTSIERKRSIWMLSEDDVEGWQEGDFFLISPKVKGT